jgi:hypothetical protein
LPQPSSAAPHRVARPSGGRGTTARGVAVAPQAGSRITMPEAHPAGRFLGSVAERTRCLEGGGGGGGLGGV